MIRIFEYKITLKNDEVQVKYFLKNKGYSSKIISLLKQTENGILVNNNYVFVTYNLKIGDILLVKIEEDSNTLKIVPKNIDVDIVYEDEDLLVVNKQAGLAVHPSIGNFDTSLANALAYRNPDFVFRCINRLDKNTSGLLIVAKNKLSGAILSDMVKNNTIKREYLAIIKNDFPYKNGVIYAPISRENESVIKRTVNLEYGQKSITYFEKMYTKNGYSCISLNLKTGRTHQIRVHLEYLGYPIVGDFLYNPDYEKINRQALHSAKLEFIHPITKQKMVFNADLPQDMQNIFND